MNKSPWKNEKFAKKNIVHIDEKFLHGTEQEVDFIERELNLNKCDRVIDLGCGAGRHSIELVKRGLNVVGVDISLVLLKAARKRSGKLKKDLNFVNGDLKNIENLFNSKETNFQGAICLCESVFGVLGGEKQDLKFLKNVNKLLSTGSKFILTTFNGIRRYRNIKKKESKFDYIRGIFHWECPEEECDELLKEDTRIYIPSEIKMMFELSGFSDVKIFGCSPGEFKKQKLLPEDVEMMVIGKKL